MKETQ